MTTDVFKSAHYEAMLRQCTAAIVACQELRKSSNAAELHLAFEAVSAYLPILDTIARDAPTLRKEAHEVAAQCALQKAVLGWHCSGLRPTVSFAQEAVIHAKQTSNISLLLSAYSKLAWAHFYIGASGAALATAEEARSCLEEYGSRGKQEPLSPCIQGGTYSTLALMQAKNKKPSDEALGKAAEIDPGNETIAMMEFTRSSQLIEAAQIHYHQGNQTRALEALNQLIDPETLISKQGKSGTGRISAIIALSMSELKTKNRDMDRMIYYWKNIIDGALTMKSEWTFDKACMIYENMEYAWPDDRRIEILREQMVHW